MRNDKKDYIIDSFLKEFDSNKGFREACIIYMDEYIKNIASKPQRRINKVYDSLQDKTNKLQTRIKNSATKSKLGD